MVAAFVGKRKNFVELCNPCTLVILFGLLCSIQPLGGVHTTQSHSLITAFS